MTNITAMNTNFRQFITALKEEGLGCKRPDGLRVPLSAIHFTPEWNIREIDPEHVAKIVNTMRAGETVDALELEPVLVNGEPRFVIVDGHHSYTAMLELGIEMTDAIIFKGTESDKVIRAYNSTQGKVLTLIEKARAFKRLQNEGMKNKEISDRTGESPSVITNALAVLKGDAELQKMVDDNEISCTRAVNFIRKYGDDATKFARLETSIANPVLEEESETLTVASSGDSAEVLPTRKAAKVSKKQGLRTKVLSAKKTNDALSMIKLLSARAGETSIENLPAQVIEKLNALATELKEIEEYNRSLAEMLQETAVK